MQKTTTNLAQESLLSNYLPADYLDSFCREVSVEQPITPQQLVRYMFTNLPWWIASLMWIRNHTVKLLGLKTGNFEEYLNEMTLCHCDNELVLGMNDKHLVFYVSLWCGEMKNSQQMLKINTIVNYNNFVGKVYFFIIKPFHKVIIMSLLKRIK